MEIAAVLQLTPPATPASPASPASLHPCTPAVLPTSACLQNTLRAYDKATANRRAAAALQSKGGVQERAAGLQSKVAEYERKYPKYLQRAPPDPAGAAAYRAYQQDLSSLRPLRATEADLASKSPAARRRLWAEATGTVLAPLATNAPGYDILLAGVDRLAEQAKGTTKAFVASLGAIDNAGGSASSDASGSAGDASGSAGDASGSSGGGGGGPPTWTDSSGSGGGGGSGTGSDTAPKPSGPCSANGQLCSGGFIEQVTGRQGVCSCTQATPVVCSCLVRCAASAAAAPALQRAHWEPAQRCLPPALSCPASACTHTHWVALAARPAPSPPCSPACRA